MGKLHRYQVPIIGGINDYYSVIAENKTMARRIAEGETQPWIKVKGKIIDMGEVERHTGKETK